MKVLLVGVGGVGESIAVIVQKHSWLTQMVLADYNLERVKQVQAKLGDPARFPAEQVDATSEAQLVDFLYKLGDGNSLIRVRALSLRPDPPRQNLGGNITLIASYQKKPSVRPASAPAPATAPVPAGTVKTNKPPTLVVPAASKPATPTKK